MELNLKYELELGKIQRCRERVSKEVRIFIQCVQNVDIKGY